MEKKIKILLICSGGGHLFELYLLKKLWINYDRIWVTHPGQDTKYLLRGEKLYPGYFPTRRNIKNFIKNLFLASQVLRKEKPEVVLSTGAGICVPFIYLGKIFGCRTVYIELLTRVNSISLSGKLIYFFVDHFIVQWPELGAKYKKALFKGKIYDIHYRGHRKISF